MITPYLITSNAADAIKFYVGAFGATELVRLSMPDGKIAHAELQLPGGRVMLADEFPDMGYKSPRALGGSAVSVHLTVDDVDALMARAVAAGGTVSVAVADQFDGERRGTLIDPFGHIWLVATVRETVGPEAMVARFQKMMAGGGEA
jgi:PhnB protein